MTPVPERAWKRVCPAAEVPNHTGVAARFGRRQIAAFVVDGKVYALDNVDPVTGAGVISRGIVGDRGGVLKVSSPIYKESYALESGESLDQPHVRLETFGARIDGEGWIEILLEVSS
ncbi:MAG: nitrite reductase small subunit NirD [Myxococcota bacterium]